MVNKEPRLELVVRMVLPQEWVLVELGVIPEEGCSSVLELVLVVQMVLPQEWVLAGLASPLVLELGLVVRKEAELGWVERRALLLVLEVSLVVRMVLPEE